MKEQDSCDCDGPASPAISHTANGAGLAVHVAVEACGYRPSPQTTDEWDYEKMREDMYDCILEEMQKRYR
ncbi:MAG: hypothetical protein Q4B69_01465 [Slackia sp.]|nr:hypothetical protein [Slackia sp.]